MCVCVKNMYVHSMCRCVCVCRACMYTVCVGLCIHIKRQRLASGVVHYHLSTLLLRDKRTWHSLMGWTGWPAGMAQNWSYRHG